MALRCAIIFFCLIKYKAAIKHKATIILKVACIGGRKLKSIEVLILYSGRRIKPTKSNTITEKM